MQPLLVLTATDGSTLALGEDPDVGLLFEQDHGAPEPVPDGFAVVWPVIDRRQHVVFAGDAAPGVDRVEIQLPNDCLTCRVRDAGARRVWMSFPEPLEALDGAVAIARWLAGPRIVATRQTAPLRSPWSGYAPVELGRRTVDGLRP